VSAPEIRYARSGDVHIAYQALGEGPFDLVYVPGAVSNVELSWDNPVRAEAYRRLASISRLILFDKRGTGLSDRVSGMPSLEMRMDDVRAVLDAVGSERAALFGTSEGGPMSVLFAATYPERTFALVLFGSTPRFVWAPDFPWAPTVDDYERRIAEIERRWGSPEFVREMFENWVPSMAHDEAALRNFGRVHRNGASPGAAAALQRMNMEIDVREVLPSIHVPTLVIHRTEMSVDVRGARLMAERIPGAQYLELTGRDNTPFSVGDADQIFDEISRFLTESWEQDEGELERDRILATVLFTDIVGSTQRAVELGDARWRELLASHHSAVRSLLARYRGTEIDTAGDGFFASFDGPARGVRCASAIVERVEELGLEIRAGLHTGECEIVDGRVGGIAVHIGARVAARAAPGEVLVSSTVRDLVAGSGLEFEDRGAAELKGVPGEWRLYAVKQG
jgi:class 3 adenylate cyclase